MPKRRASPAIGKGKDRAEAPAEASDTLDFEDDFEDEVEDESAAAAAAAVAAEDDEMMDADGGASSAAAAIAQSEAAAAPRQLFIPGVDALEASLSRPARSSVLVRVHLS